MSVVYGEKMKEFSIFEIAIITVFAPIGGGGNPLRAWVLACFDTANSCINCIFTDLDKFIRYPELVSGFCDVKKWRIIYV